MLDWSSEPPSRPGRALPKLLRLAVAIYVGLAALLYLRQDAVLFQRRTLTDEQASAITASHPRTEEVRIVAGEGVTLRGWFAPGGTTGAAPLLIYFGGNAEEVSWMLDRRQQLPGWSLLLVNYRGYGRSDGRPTEADLVADALRVHDAVADRADVDRHRIVAMGRSLGSGVAVHLAAARRLAGVVLVTPYDSMVQVARMHYPLIPVDLLLRHRFDSIALAADIPTPMLALVAGRDDVVPSTRARALQSAWGGPTTWRLFPDADHVDISRSPGFWETIDAFLASLPPAPR